jgi:hypothetical protein
MVKPFYLFSCIQVPFILLQIINFVLAIFKIEKNNKRIS